MHLQKEKNRRETILLSVYPRVFSFTEHDFLIGYFSLSTEKTTFRQELGMQNLRGFSMEKSPVWRWNDQSDKLSHREKQIENEINARRSITE